jgi:hypothetical protein
MRGGAQDSRQDIRTAGRPDSRPQERWANDVHYVSRYRNRHGVITAKITGREATPPTFPVHRVG